MRLRRETSNPRPVKLIPNSTPNVSCQAKVIVILKNLLGSFKVNSDVTVALYVLSNTSDRTSKNTFIIFTGFIFYIPTGE